MNSRDELLLAGDIGGTKTDLALFDQRQWPGPPVLEKSFVNRHYHCFEELLQDFSRLTELPSRCSFGVAGPVLDGRATMTNLAWVLDTEEIADRFHFQDVSLINDLVATAQGALLLSGADLHPINRGRGGHTGAVAVLAPGTGLGEAFLLEDKTGTYRAYPSEGGHASFAPRNERQQQLLSFLWQERDHVSVEQVCSGSGMPNLYRFLRTMSQEPPWFRDRMAGAADPTPLLVQAALGDKLDNKSCPVARDTLGLFLEILADEAANLALKVLATGGIFLGGGLLPRILPLIEPHRFSAQFQRGVYRKILADIPIQVIVNPKAALLGAAAHAFSETAKGD